MKINKTTAGFQMRKATVRGNGHGGKHRAAGLAYQAMLTLLNHISDECTKKLNIPCGSSSFKFYNSSLRQFECSL